MTQFIYIHVPFCVRRCPYCDFFKMVAGGRAASEADRWLDWIEREMDLLAAVGALSRSDPIASMYFGGGTPSLISAQRMKQFLARVREGFTLSRDAEITVEMQPATADEDKIAGYAVAGVNRFSIGAQTFDPTLLALLERHHSVRDIYDLIHTAKQYGSVSIDLICALPGQTLDLWRHELDTLLSLDIPHASIYELTFYQGTRLTQALERGEVIQSHEELRLAIFEYTATTMSQAGYEHYEISNFARGQSRSRHNENYWRLGNYVGLGAGAHSFLFPHRYANPNDVALYREEIASGTLARRCTDSADHEVFILENLLMALRVREGVARKDFAKRFGIDPLTFRPAKFEVLRADGFVGWDDERLWLTFAGWLRFDSILTYLM